MTSPAPCAVCGRVVGLTKYGLIRFHYPLPRESDATCQGVGHLPTAPDRMTTQPTQDKHDEAATEENA